jgi:hypothetical protein
MSTSKHLIQAAAGGKKLYTSSTLQLITTAGSGTLSVPTDAVGMRVAIVGGGGGGAGNGSAGTNARACGGSGAGCAATKIVTAESITYTIGAGGTASSNGANSTASFGDYSLVGTGGLAGDVSANSITVSGSTGTGGDYNFSGGSSTGTTQGKYVASTGGGGAGPNGDGQNGTQVTSTGLTTSPTGGDGEFTNTGWGPGGGAVGNLRSVNSQAAAIGNAVGMGVEYQNAARSGRIMKDIDSSKSVGVMGSGGAAYTISSVNTNPPSGFAGGDGALLVEWFYFD